MVVIPISIHEYAFNVDEFENPKVYSDTDAIAILLSRLLLLEPGLFQSHPEMGVGLVSKYRYQLSDKLPDLTADFRKQIEKYLPQFQGVEVNAYMVDSRCIITAKIDKYVYGFLYSQDTNELNSTFKALTDL